MSIDDLLSALDGLDLDTLSDDQLRRLADITDNLQPCIEQESMDRDDPPEED